jgi:phosphatidylserine decarboxylase
MSYAHQYIERDSGQVRTELLYGDPLIRTIYSPIREHADWLFKILTGARASQALGLLNFDRSLGTRVLGNRKFLDTCGIDYDECLDSPEMLDTARKVFERKIRYWECRPMPLEPSAIVSPADARVLVGSFSEISQLFIKEKFFGFQELLGIDQPAWLEAFKDGDFAIFRLTADKYHYNHVPVSGQVVDIYAIEGHYHSCNPQAVIEMATPYSKNKRVVTIIDTNVPGGSGVGLVAMIEIVAMMIGRIVQCYSTTWYDNPVPVTPGLFLHKGQPKSIYQPGSSTDVLIFQRNRMRFAEDLLQNQTRSNISSRFTNGFRKPLVETDLKVRSLIGYAVNPSTETMQFPGGQP